MLRKHYNFKVCCLYLLSVVFIPIISLSQWNIEYIGTGAGGSITMDSVGHVHLCYLSDMYEGDLIYAIRDGEHWAEDTIDNSGEVNQCVIATGITNEIYVAYVTSNWNTNTHTLQFISNDGTNWSSPETITSNNMGITSLSIDVDPDGFVHLGYIRSSGGASNGPLIYYTNRSGAWDQTVISQLYEDYPYGSASMAVDKNGHAHFAMYNMPDGPAYQTNAPGGDWSDVISIQDNWTGGQMESMIIDIAVDTEAIPHVSYVGSDDGEPYEHHRYATKAGADWMTEQVDEGSEYSEAHAIALDPNANNHITYYHMATDELRYTNSAEAWSHETLDVCESTEGSLDIVVDSEGYAHICYQTDPEHFWYATNNVEMPAPQIVLSHDTLSFGVIDTGYVIIDSLYIRNDGMVDLHISGIQLTGGDSAEFSIEHSCGTIEPRDSCKVRVTFAPDSLGSKQVTLEITSDDPDKPVAEAVITGRTPAPVIQADPGVLVFALTEVGGADTLGLTIKNAGDRDLKIHSLKLSGGAPETFDYRSACGTISPDDSCDIDVIFLPASQGTKTAILTIYSNDPDNPEVTVSLEGRTPAPHIEFPGEELDFGMVPVANLATEQLVLENTGERQLNISDLTISGMNPSLFHASNTCGAISAEGFCSIEVTFRPMSKGPKNAELTIASNDPDQPAYSIRLRGSGGESYSNAFTYGTEAIERFFCVDALSSGGSIAGGQTAGRAYLAALSPAGDFIWQKAYSSDAYWNWIYTVRELWDGGFVVGGSLYLRYRWIARLDSRGEILWQKTPESDYGGKIYDVQITSDMGFIAVGETVPNWSPDQDDQDSDMWIGKFDSTGVLLWQKTIGKDGPDHSEQGANVIEVETGNFIVAGGPTGSSQMSRPYSALVNHPDGGYVYGGHSTKLWKISSIGAIVWQKKLELSYPYEFELIHFSPEDAIQWQYRYPLADSSVVCDLAITAEGDIIATGTITNPDNKDMRVMCLAKTGGIMWQKQFGASGDQEGYQMQMSTTRSIIIGGYYDTEDQREDGWLCQLTPTGHLDGCASSSLMNTYSINKTGDSELTALSMPCQIPSVRFIDAEVAYSDAYATARNICTGVTVDIDHDGVSDTEEAGPDGLNTNYDGNNDGLPDGQQDNVASMHTSDGGAYVTIESGASSQLQDVSAEENPSPDDQPGEFDFPLGFFDFSITGIEVGGSASVHFLIPEGYTPNTYYKYAGTEANPMPHWYEFLFDGSVGAELSDTEITLHFIDGQLGDEDLRENAAITDIGGPAIIRTLIAPLPTSPEDGANSISLPVEFTWEPVEEALLYQLQVSSDDEHSDILCNKDSIQTETTEVATLQPNSTYFWRVRAMNEADTSHWSASRQFSTSDFPDTYSLYQNYPNPCRSATTIEFALPEECHVRIAVYDLRGSCCEIMKNKIYPAGYHKILWEPEHYSNGIYFYRLSSDNFSDTKKLVILK